MPHFDAGEVQRYYDRHTPAFVAYGQGGGIGAIHRAVWGPGVDTRQQAFRYVEDRILERLATRATPDQRAHVVDLGCGVGGSLCYLASRLGVHGTGVTLSPLQARLAEQRIRDARLSDRVTCLEGDYCDLPSDIAPADVVYAIESFVHAADPLRFLATCARLVRPGGLLTICDDVRRPTTDPAASRAIERFQRGWHINTLLRRDELQALAAAAGFDHESTEDLSAYLELARPRDRLVAALVALVGWLPRIDAPFGHLTGGSALQTCLRKGWIGYDLALFRRHDGRAVHDV